MKYIVVSIYIYIERNRLKGPFCICVLSVAFHLHSYLVLTQCYDHCSRSEGHHSNALRSLQTRGLEPLKSDWRQLPKQQPSLTFAEGNKFLEAISGRWAEGKWGIKCDILFERQFKYISFQAFLEWIFFLLPSIKLNNAIESPYLRAYRL